MKKSKTHKGKTAESAETTEVNFDRVFERSVYSARPWLQSYPDDVPATPPAHGFYDLAEMFDRSAERWPSRVAFRQFGRSLTYADTRAESMRVCKYLREHCTARDRVAVMLPNCLAQPVIFQAIMRAKMVAVNVNPLYTAPELGTIASDARPVAIFVWDGALPVLIKSGCLDFVPNIIVVSLFDYLPAYKRALMTFALRYIKRRLPRAPMPESAVRLSRLRRQYTHIDDTSAKATPAQPRDQAPNNAQPHDGQPHDGQPHDGSSHNAQPQDAQPHNAQPHDGSSHNAQPHNAQPHDGSSHNAQPQDAQSHDGQPHDGSSNNAQPLDRSLADVSASQQDSSDRQASAEQSTVDESLGGQTRGTESGEAVCSEAAVLQYTGGTTGLPKGAELTHKNLLANVTQIISYLHSDLKDPDHQLAVVTPLPLYHIFALTVNHLLFYALGAENRLIANPRNLDSVISTLKLKPAFNVFVAVNTLFQALLNRHDFATVDFSSLRWCIGGGMQVREETARGWGALTGQELLQGYGLTEASPVVCFNPHTTLSFNASVGLPVPGTDIMIVDEHGGAVGFDCPGELLVRGEQVMAGYWNKPDDTALCLNDGWLHTGDMACVDESGYCRIVDRIKDIINVSGFKVYPNEIESVVEAHASISECACVGVREADGSEQVKIVVVRAPGASLESDDLRAWLTERLTAYKRPRYIEWSDALAKTSVGKVLRRAVRHSDDKTTATANASQTGAAQSPGDDSAASQTERAESPSNDSATSQTGVAQSPSDDSATSQTERAESAGEEPAASQSGTPQPPGGDSAASQSGTSESSDGDSAASQTERNGSA